MRHAIGVDRGEGQDWRAESFCNAFQTGAGAEQIVELGQGVIKQADGEVAGQFVLDFRADIVERGRRTFNNVFQSDNEISLSDGLRSMNGSHLGDR